MWLLSIDDLTIQEIGNFFQKHLDEMHAITPPDSTHALNWMRYVCPILPSGQLGRVMRCADVERSKN
ncbi:hypothetical protein [Acaryochloris sp. IP29b_bin.137]|uniref:hypothetical protein n=1 Tax=Acaryochloris sp. IP29b_bin.137 TaxID=2969217 RepID=UPI00261C26B1|nr:hypothetical protein [Acaryochloris sp. IP29b_bin.137]